MELTMVCDYMMPCGWCELREMICPAAAPLIMPPHDKHTANLREYAQDFGVSIEQAEEDLRKGDN